MRSTAWMQELTNQLPHMRWLELPMPPSVNKYWRVGEVGNRGKFLTKAAKQFRVDVQSQVLQSHFPRHTGPVIAVLEFHPSEKMCDLDNYEKALWDAVQSAGVLYNDCQVMCVFRYWGSRRKGRGVTLGLSPLMDQELLLSVPSWSDQSQAIAGLATKRSSPGGTKSNPSQPTRRKPRPGQSRRKNKYAADRQTDDQ